ncbi:MAG TPA: hypothetical protein DCS42_12340 [Nitrospiraceae bacterium]|nr:hypothetical protein [Nitrospiraceae bacterium]
MNPETRKTRAFLNFMLRQVRTEALKFVNGKTPRKWFMMVGGICWNLEGKMTDAGTNDAMAHNVDKEMSRLFGEYLDTLDPEEAAYRSLVYPVGGKDEFDTGTANGDLWENPERLRLLDWLIEKSE